MKKLITAVALLTLSTAAPLVAQERAAISPQPVVACPHPISVTLKGPNPPAPDPGDFGKLYPAVKGSEWNQTAIDKAFGTTFHLPRRGECCVWTSATVTLTIKALQGGAFNSASSGNDGINILSQGTSVAGTPAWPNGCHTGDTRTVSISVPASALAQGQFSLYVQDDTAVVDATVQLQGCCIR